MAYIIIIYVMLFVLFILHSHRSFEIPVKYTSVFAYIFENVHAADFPSFTDKFSDCSNQSFRWHSLPKQTGIRDIALSHYMNDLPIYSSKLCIPNWWARHFSIKLELLLNHRQGFAWVNCKRTIPSQTRLFPWMNWTLTDMFCQ